MVSLKAPVARHAAPAAPLRLAQRDARALTEPPTTTALLLFHSHRYTDTGKLGTQVHRRRHREAGTEKRIQSHAGTGTVAHRHTRRTRTRLWTRGQTDTRAHPLHSFGLLAGAAPPDTATLPETSPPPAATPPAAEAATAPQFQQGLMTGSIRVVTALTGKRG